jgi:hypothetical protein
MCKQTKHSPGLRAFLYDAKRLAVSNQYITAHAPLQLYYAALILAPSESIIRRQFEEQMPSWIELKSKVQAQ